MNKQPDENKNYELRLYVAGQTPKSLAAIANLSIICEENLKGEYHIEVIDLVKTPQLAKGDQIIAVPTLVRKLPQPIKKIIGDLSNEDKVLVGLDIKPMRGRIGVTMSENDTDELGVKMNIRYLLKLYITGMTPRAQAGDQEHQENMRGRAKRPLRPGSDRCLSTTGTGEDGTDTGRPHLDKETAPAAQKAGRRHVQQTKGHRGAGDIAREKD